MVESVGDRARRKRPTSGHEVQFTRSQRSCLGGRQTGWTSEPEEAVVSEQLGNQLAQATRLGAAATPAISSAGRSAASTRCNSAMRASVAVHATGSGAPPSIGALDVIGQDPAEFLRPQRPPVAAAPGSMSAISSVSAISWAKIPGNRLGPHPPAVRFEPRDRRASPDADRFQRGPATDAAFGQPGVRPGRHIGPPLRVVVRSRASREPRTAGRQTSSSE